VRRAAAIDRVVDAIAESFATELNSVGVVNDAVEDGVGEGRIADDIVQLWDGSLTGDQEGMEVVAILDDFEQIAALFCIGVTNGVKLIKNHRFEIIEAAG